MKIFGIIPIESLIIVFTISLVAYFIQTSWILIRKKGNRIPSWLFVVSVSGLFCVFLIICTALASVSFPVEALFFVLVPAFWIAYLTQMFWVLIRKNESNVPNLVFTISLIGLISIAFLFTSVISLRSM
jgi:hypothetical protein